ncbi:MAG: hypothetical protein COT15_02220 [Candidatus Diapherotrites archaeon CG08_land_8_20_14_0_20_34_12]|nr:MAG: hypothetical protein COT15_02220 [Candidatus Diapherotrites archaeon CG08_land_8_20_14_0_20_34_12]
MQAQNPEEINLGLAVTFIPNKTIPIHNWFYYKEGYSKELVEWLIKKWKISGKILDPFCGVGTTLLAAKELGFESIGCDVSPLAVLAAHVKTRDYNLEELKQEFSKIRGIKLMPEGRVQAEKWMKRLFYTKTLENILIYKGEIEKIKDEKIKDFFMLALIACTDMVMLATKQGGSLRLTKKPPIPIKPIFIRKIKHMVRDLERKPVNVGQGKEPEVLQADAREMLLEKESVDCIITSPPYLNKIEYTTVYKAELGIFFKHQETRLRAFIGEEKFQAENETDEPLIAQAYFKDIEKVLQNCYEMLKPKGLAFFELAGACFPTHTIECDERIAEIAERIGFKLKEIVVCREIACYRIAGNSGKVRESIVVLEK